MAMGFLQTFDLAPFLDTCVSYATAFVCGTLIGAERQYRQRTAGLRTNVLVAVGAAAFVDLAQRIGTTADATRVISYVVSGIGFLGAGVIMKEGPNVRGLNTAATLWCSAAVGACAGTDMVAEAVLLTLVVLAGNTMLRPLVTLIDRVPFEGRAMEATYTVSVIADSHAIGPLRDILVEHLERGGYPVADVALAERSETQTEATATLTATSVDPMELDALADHMAQVHGVDHATWDAHARS